ncbi:4-oxalomesaconate tautomerase [Microbacterium sp. LRZ72]|uniref:PrpF domain-containing protein n=1 Tax=Microbacterium sp. LRZ72 TaxID=2942481 RepID=UPI0029A3935D|nr:PrpF domain-containing protein [Microbacterium sp. LRZ72]MDX2376945.1 4-oxalomesaconate tautomerase [Microbacterium sp. LRZ72]
MAADPLRDGIPCMLMRGGTSKGAYFLAEDVPADRAARDDLMLRIMGTPDPRQIDGIGGAHPLTSKVAIVSRSESPDADVDYLFLQLGVGEPQVSDTQTCGNLLAGVAPFAIERGLVEADADETAVRIRLINTGDLATSHVATPGGVVDYDGDAAIDGVPGTACAIELAVERAVPLLPSGNVVDEIEGHRVTLVDNGMAVVLLDASEFGVAGDETPEQLEENADLAAEVERVRLAAAPLMGIENAADQSVPKMFLLSPPAAGGAIRTRAFIPRRVHTSIGVLMAASVAAGIRIPGAVGAEMAQALDGDETVVEHPTGAFPARVAVTQDADGAWIGSSVSERTARKLFDGRVFPRPRR